MGIPILVRRRHYIESAPRSRPVCLGLESGIDPGLGGSNGGLWSGSGIRDAGDGVPEEPGALVATSPPSPLVSLPPSLEPPPGGRVSPGRLGAAGDEITLWSLDITRFDRTRNCPLYGNLKDRMQNDDHNLNTQKLTSGFTGTLLLIRVNYNQHMVKKLHKKCGVKLGLLT